MSDLVLRLILNELKTVICAVLRLILNELKTVICAVLDHSSVVFVLHESILPAIKASNNTNLGSHSPCGNNVGTGFNRAGSSLRTVKPIVDKDGVSNVTPGQYHTVNIGLAAWLDDGLVLWEGK